MLMRWIECVLFLLQYRVSILVYGKEVNDLNDVNTQLLERKCK